MAAFVALETVNNYRGIANGSRRHLREAFDGGSSDADRSLARVMGEPHFVIRGTTDSNTAAASSPVISLSDYGVDFPADHVRNVVVDTLAWNGANRYRFVTSQQVLGGTNPTLKGRERFLTNCVAYYSATTADGTATTEVAAECIGPEWWDGADPVAADASSNAIVVSWLGGNAPARLIIPGGVSHTDAAAAAADARSFQHGVTSLANGTTTVFVSDVATPTAANFSNASAFRASAMLYPPIHTPVLIDTSATPDEVFIGALGISSDVVEYYIRVYLEDPVRALLA